MRRLTAALALVLATTAAADVAVKILDKNGVVVATATVAAGNSATLTPPPGGSAIITEIVAPVPPVPVPGPIPPQPVPVPPNPTTDPLYATLQAALYADPVYKTDPAKALGYVKSLAGFYRGPAAADARNRDMKTAGDLVALVRQHSAGLLPDGAIDGVRRALATEFAVKLPPDPAQLLDLGASVTPEGVSVTYRDNYATQFARASTLLEALK